MQSTVKQMRMIWSFMLVAAFIYVWLPEQLHVSETGISSQIYFAFSACAVGMLVAMVIMRKATVMRAAAVLRTSPEDRVALNKWRQGQIATVALCEAFALYGLVIRFLGGTRLEASMFYILGITAMVVYWPQPAS